MSELTIVSQDDVTSQILEGFGRPRSQGVHERGAAYVSKASRTLAGEPITTTLSAVGKQFSEDPRNSAEIEAYADAMTDMVGAYHGQSEVSIKADNAKSRE